MKKKRETKKKTARRNLNRAVLIEQITERLYDSATEKETLDVANILLRTKRFSTKKYRLIWRDK